MGCAHAIRVTMWAEEVHKHVRSGTAMSLTGASGVDRRFREKGMARFQLEIETECQARRITHSPPLFRRLDLQLVVAVVDGDDSAAEKRTVGFCAGVHGHRITTDIRVLTHHVRGA